MILKIKCFFVRWLRAFHLIPDVWYKCEIDEIKKDAEELYVFFNGNKSDNCDLNE